MSRDGCMLHGRGIMFAITDPDVPKGLQYARGIVSAFAELAGFGGREPFGIVRHPPMR